MGAITLDSINSKVFYKSRNVSHLSTLSTHRHQLRRHNGERASYPGVIHLQSHVTRSDWQRTAVEREGRWSWLALLVFDQREKKRIRPKDP